MMVRDMVNLYVGYNEQNDFHILICTWDDEAGALVLAKKYGAEAGLEGEWEIISDPAAIDSVKLDCSYVITPETHERKALLYDNMLNHISGLVGGSDLVDTLHAIGFTDDEIKKEGLWPENEEDAFNTSYEYWKSMHDEEMVENK